MGRNRTPTVVLDAKGAFTKNPNRARPDEPTTDHPIGNPPSYLSKDEKKIWKERVKQAIPGVLKYSDRTAFELLVRLDNTMRNDRANMRAWTRSASGAARVLSPAFLKSRFVMDEKEKRIKAPRKG